MWRGAWSGDSSSLFLGQGLCWGVGVLDNRRELGQGFFLGSGMRGRWGDVQLNIERESRCCTHKKRIRIKE